MSKIKGKPIIMVNHGLAAEQDQYNILLRTVFSIIDRITYSRADSVITHSPSKLPKDVSYHFIKPGFDKTRLKKDFSLAKLYKTKGIVILFTGRLMKSKGVEYLIEGLNDIRASYTCFIVGDGPERKKLEILSKKLKTNVIFTGFRKDVNRFLSIADVFVMPSLSESLNYSMLEAAYMKVPIIATDLEIFPKNSFISIDKKSPKSITEAIKEFKTNTKLKNSLMKNAYEFTKHFSWKNTAKEYHQLIKSILMVSK